VAARPRSQRKRNWPDGLYERNGYFSWRNPITGEELGIGRVALVEASSQAIEANLHVRELLKKPRLVDRLGGAGGRTVDELILLHDGDDDDLYSGRLGEKLKAKELAENTVKTLRSCGRAVLAAWKGRLVASIDTADVDKLLEHWKAADQKRMALAVRSYLSGYFFRFAEAKGWIPRGTNPSLITDKIKARVKRARLSLEAFQAIYDAAGALDPWVRHSMALAIVSARRREDLAVADFRQYPDSLVYVADRKLWVIQKKVDRHVGALHIRLPFELHLDALGWSLEWAIAQCRDDIVSRRLIHHTRPRGKHSQPGDEVFIDTITKGFRRARDRSGLTWPDELEPPTFHEIRSLAARLYEKQGNVDVQVLLGHSDPATTEIYKDSRGIQWTDVKIA
jgi:integrase